MFKRILVATDGSETSEAALRDAAKLAKLFGAGLRIVHVADELGLISGSSSLLEDVRRTIMQEGQTILSRALATARASSVEADTKLIETFSAHGRIATYIVEEAKAWNADLIVAGTHGRRGFDRWIMGSVAEGVVHAAPTAVLLVRVPQAAKAKPEAAAINRTDSAA